MKTILISGGNGKFAKALIEANTKFNILAPKKKEMDIRKTSSIINYIKTQKIDYFIHTAAFSTPMASHKIELEKSIMTNIIGSANVAVVCLRNKIKPIYISTNFVYPGKKGGYSENDYLHPVNEYGWSKLGGECPFHIYKNSLILRICMNDDNFPHKHAFSNYISSFIKKSDAAKITLQLLNMKGIVNVGGKTQSVYDFAKKIKKNIKKKKIK